MQSIVLVVIWPVGYWKLLLNNHKQLLLLFLNAASCSCLITLQLQACRDSSRVMVTPAEVTVVILTVLLAKFTSGFEALCCTDSALDLLPRSIGDQVWAGRDLEGLCCC